MAITIWRLRDPTGQDALCAIALVENDSFEVRLERENDVISTERSSSFEAAMLRAEAMWIESRLDGWTEL